MSRSRAQGAQHLCREQGCEGGQGKGVMVSSPGGAGVQDPCSGHPGGCWDGE